MRRIKSSARVVTSLLVAAGALGFANHAGAQQVSGATSGGTVSLATMLLEVRKPANQFPIGKMRGTGSMDPVIAQVSPNRLLIADTASVQYNGNSGCQGMLTLVELTKEGPKVIAQHLLPREDGERVHMKMNLVPLDYQSGNQTAVSKTGLSEYRVLVTYATEDNQGDNGNGPGGAGSLGSNNGNPQTVAWVVKIGTGAGTPRATALDIADGSNDGGLIQPLRKINTVSLTGQQDAQQYGAESVICDGDVCSLALQRNNQTTNVSKFQVNANGTMTRLAQRRTNNQNGQHSRPVFARDFKGREFEAIVDTNDQPARNIRLWEQNTQTEATIKTQRVMQGIVNVPQNQQVFVSRPYAGTVRQLSDALNPAAAAALQTKAPVFVFAGTVTPVRNRNQVGGDNQNGHGGGATRNLLMALDPDTFAPVDGSGLPALNSLPVGDAPGAIKVNPAAYGRHASMLIANAFGPVGKALPAAVMLSASSTGSGAGYAQFIPFDPAAGKFDVKATKNRFNLGFADIANATKGKRNPQDQAGSFLGGITDVVNPFYGDTTTKMPEVKSWAIVPVSGAFNITGDTADKSMGLRVAFIPQTWTDQVAVTPGPATPVDQIPTGPSPQSTGPAAGTPGGDDGSSGTDNGGDQGGDDGNSGGGYSSRPAASGGCSTSSTPTSGYAGLALVGLGLAAMVTRRRKESK